METPIYFAYGSNMLLARIEDRLGRVDKISTYEFPNWKLDFSAGWSRAVGNMVPSPGDTIQGVLYKLNDRQIALLDQYEGVPSVYVKRYQQVVVKLPNSFLRRRMLAFAYIDNMPCVWNRLPDLTYLNIIIDGADENGLINTYNRLVQFKADNYKLSKGSRHKPKL